MGMGAGMGMQIVGTELQGWASILAQQAMQHALGAELRKQQGFRLQATGQQFLHLPRQGSEQANKEIASGSQERQAGYSGLNSYSGATGADKSAIATEGKSRADLAGYGDWMTNRSLDTAKTGSEIQRINSRAGGSAQLFPYQMNRAQHSQDAMQAIGQAISSLGGGSSNVGQALQSTPPVSQKPNYYGPSQNQGYSPPDAQGYSDGEFRTSSGQYITSLY